MLKEQKDLNRKLLLDWLPKLDCLQAEHSVQQGLIVYERLQ